MEECCHYYVEIESTIGADLNDVYLEIDTCTRPILISDLPDNIPVSYIDGLDDYLSEFIDDYEIDCGTP
jgi:hypothetical protein